MSINNFLDTVPFSISGLQDLSIDTINGNQVLSTINIAGQTIYLSWDPNTSTLTLLIPNATSGITGLLTSTDWNTFNNKENTLTFTSPLTRVGNNISFDFSNVNNWTGNNTFNGTTTTINNNIILGGSLFYTAAVSTTTGYVLYIDNATNYITKGLAPVATNLLPLNNVWTGTLNTFNTILAEDNITIRNNANNFQVFNFYRYEAVYPADFLYFSNQGELVYTDNTSPVVWAIDSVGKFTGSEIKLTPKTSPSDTLQVWRGSTYPNEYLYYNTSGVIGVWNGISSSWSITSDPLLTSTLNIGTVLASSINATGTITSNSVSAGTISATSFLSVVGSITIQNTANRNNLRYTHFEPTTSINNWISCEFSYDGVDKPVIGNLGLAVPGYGACFGGHNSALNAWVDCWINPGATTYTGNLNATAFNYPSDRRIKTDISYLDASKSIKFVKGLKPAKFKKCVDDRIEFLKKEAENFELGFIAQDIQEISETESQKMIVTTETYMNKERLTIKPFYIIAELVNANKEMINKIEQLETDNKLLQDKIEQLQTDNKLLQERISKIENIIKNKKCIALI